MEKYELWWMREYPFEGYDCNSVLHHWSRVWEYPFVFEKIRGGKILDVGGGWSFFPAYMYHHLHGTKISISDNDPHIVNWHKKNNISYGDIYLDDITESKFPDNEFDCIVCISTLEHIPDKIEALREMKRILKPDGTLLLSFDISLDNKNHMTSEETKECLDELGIKDERFPDSMLTSHNAPSGLPGKTGLLKKMISRIRRGSALGHIPYLTVRGVVCGKY